METPLESTLALKDDRKGKSGVLEFQRLPYLSPFPLFIPGVSDIASWLPSLIPNPLNYRQPFHGLVKTHEDFPLDLRNHEKLARPATFERVETHATGRSISVDGLAEQKSVHVQDTDAEAGLGQAAQKNHNSALLREQDTAARADEKISASYGREEQGIIDLTSPSATVLTLKRVKHCTCLKCWRKRAKPNPPGEDAASIQVEAGGKISKTFPCPKCGKTFSTQRGLKHHQTFYGVNRTKDVCFFCKRVFSSSFNLNQHLFAKHMDSLVHTHRCYYCNQVFDNQKDLDLHVQKHLSGKPHLCPKCPENFRYEEELLQHFTSHEGKR